MRYEVIICRQEAFVIEADSEDEAEEIAFDFGLGEEPRIVEHIPEETTKVLINKAE